MREVTISNDLARAILCGLEMLARRIDPQIPPFVSPPQTLRDVNYCRERLADAITQGEFDDAKRTEHDNAAMREAETDGRRRCGFEPCILKASHMGDHIFNVRGET